MGIIALNLVVYLFRRVLHIADEFDGAYVESSQRRKARMDRQSRTVERAV